MEMKKSLLEDEATEIKKQTEKYVKMYNDKNLEVKNYSF
jgi:hypothetical protein